MANCIWKFQHVATSLDAKDPYDAEGNIIFQANSAHQESQFAISDSGADSCVLGRQVTVISFTGYNARILGYDSSKGLSDLVPIVTAMIKVCLEHGEFVIWKIHQAPYIKDSDTYLLSKYQLCSRGTHVDLCSIHHKVRPVKVLNVFGLTVHDKVSKLT